MPPRISVVVPTFNRSGVLSRSLDSVLGQTLPPLEVVVVDDGSTDETEQVVRELSSELVRYVRLPEQSGAQAARNRGIREAEGDWIAFQDSDDEWLPDKLERQVALLAERDFDPWTVVHGGAFVRNVNGWAPEMERRLLGEEDALRVLLWKPATLFPAMLVSRHALERMGELDERVPSLQEWDTAIRLARFCRFVEPAEPVFVYRVGNPDAISASRLTHIRGYQYVIEKFHDEIVERCGPEAWEAHLLHQARRALDFGLWDEARRVLSLVQERDRRYYACELRRRLRLRSSPRAVTRAARSRLTRRMRSPHP